MLVVFFVNMCKVAFDRSMFHCGALALICWVMMLLLDSAHVLNWRRWSRRSHAAPCQEWIFRLVLVWLKKMVALDFRDHQRCEIAFCFFRNVVTELLLNLKVFCDFVFFFNFKHLACFVQMVVEFPLA